MRIEILVSIHKIIIVNNKDSKDESVNL